MNKKSFCVANWKMNKNIDESISFLDELNRLNLKITTSNMVICPSSIYLYYLARRNNNHMISFGCQNICNKKTGSYTGEISISMIENIGCDWVIIGHSERRQAYNETNKIIADKMELVYNSELTPILCIGESFEEKENKKTQAILDEQINTAFSKINFKKNKDILIAYEPIWAIGTGIAATLDIINENMKIIKNIINSFELNNCNLYLLYGGSVNENNATEIFNLDNVNGFLIGTSSLDVQTFYNIYKQI